MIFCKFFEYFKRLSCFLLKLPAFFNTSIQDTATLYIRNLFYLTVYIYIAYYTVSIFIPVQCLLFLDFHQ